MKKRDLYYERIPTKLLREDISYLGNILGEVIKEQEGIKFFNLVEKVRKLSKANKINLKNKNSFNKFDYRKFFYGLVGAFQAPVRLVVRMNSFLKSIGHNKVASFNV